MSLTLTKNTVTPLRVLPLPLTTLPILTPPYIPSATIPSRALSKTRRIQSIGDVSELDSMFRSYEQMVQKIKRNGPHGYMSLSLIQGLKILSLAPI